MAFSTASMYILALLLTVSMMSMYLILTFLKTCFYNTYFTCCPSRCGQLSSHNKGKKQDIYFVPNWNFFEVVQYVWKGLLFPHGKVSVFTICMKYFMFYYAVCMGIHTTNEKNKEKCSGWQNEKIRTSFCLSIKWWHVHLHWQDLQ